MCTIEPHSTGYYMGNILHWPIKYMQIKSRAVFEQHRDDSNIFFFFFKWSRWVRNYCCHGNFLQYKILPHRGAQLEIQKGCRTGLAGSHFIFPLPPLAICPLPMQTLMDVWHSAIIYTREEMSLHWCCQHCKTVVLGRFRHQNYIVRLRHKKYLVRVKKRSWSVCLSIILSQITHIRV